MNEDRIRTNAIGAGASRRLLGAPPTTAAMRTAKILSKNGRKRSFTALDTEESGEEDESPKTVEEADEEEEKPAEEEVTTLTTEKKRRRKKRRIRLTDQGLKAKRKAERRERLMAERKEMDLTGNEDGDEDDKEEEAHKSNGQEEKESEKPAQPRVRPHPSTFTPFQLFCDNILRRLVMKDPDGYFTHPVSPEDAPDYRDVIETPMDFSTIREKIEENDYEKISQFHADVELITNNAQIYNSPGSLFYIAAQKLAVLTRYYFSEKYLKYLIYSLPFGRMIPADKLEVNLQTQTKERNRPEFNKEREKIRSLIKDTMSPNEIIETSPKAIKNRLTARQPNCHIGYLDNRGGAIALNLLTPAMAGEESSKQLKLGDYLRPLEKGTPGICLPFEPIITQDYPITYTNPGPFTSFAPQYDSTWATLSKRESDLLLSCYGDKDNVADAFSLRQMVAAAGETANGFVEQMLNEITEGEHEKTIAELEGKTGTDKMMDPSSVDGRLQKTGKMLGDLATMQYKRLSKAPPATLSHVMQPEAEEAQLAGEIVQELGQHILGMEARPCDVVTPQSVRGALGLDADDLEILSEFLEV